MKFDITQRMSEVNDLMLRTKNPLHWAILNNYVRHAILELCNEWRSIMAPDMMVPHPVYRFHEPQGLKILVGMETVRSEGRRIGIGWVRTCRSRRWPSH